MRSLALAVGILLAQACATSSSDPRLHSLAELQAQRDAIEQKFRADYQAESRKVFGEVATKGGGQAEYYMAMEEWIQQRIRVFAMLAAIDGTAHAAGLFIEHGTPGDVLAPMRVLIKDLRIVVRMFGTGLMQAVKQ